MPAKHTPKYRPYLTQRQISKLMEILLKEPLDDEIASIKKALGLVLYKASNELIEPSYITSSKPRQTITEKLGFSSGELSISGNNPLEVRKAAWEKYCFSPADLTERELALAFTYKYESGLMTDEERIEYENKMMG